MDFNQSDGFFKKEPRIARGASLYLENSHGEFLMQLRTADAPREPNKWTALSGSLGARENPEETIIREIKEETGIDLKKPKFFRDYLWVCEDEKYAWYSHNFVFYAQKDIPLGEIHLTEGQKVSYLSVKEILKMDLAFNHNETFRDLLHWLGRRAL